MKSFIFNLLRRIENIRNPFILFSPLLVIFILVVLKNYDDTLWGDEPQYIRYAENLTNGFLSPPAPDIDFTAGPGYSIMIMPFIALKLPLITITLLNAIFHYLSVILVFQALKLIVSYRKALIISILLACYYDAYIYISNILTESFTFFLISLLAFCIIKAFPPDKDTKKIKFLIITGFILGYLAITKIIFGYVLICMLTGSFLLWLIKRNVPNYKKSLIITVVAFATTAPYLIYTHHITGRWLYWGTSGGNNLYWMSTPFVGEYGNYFDDPVVLSDTCWKEELVSHLEKFDISGFLNRTRLPVAGTFIALNHGKDFKEINGLNGVERDDAFKRIALNNIKSHPIKYLRNIICNAGRIIFDIPYSYQLQTYGNIMKIPKNGIIVILALMSLIITLVSWQKVMFSVRFMLFLVILYFGGSIFGSADGRMFIVVVPILIIWITYIIDKSVFVKLKLD